MRVSDWYPLILTPPCTDEEVAVKSVLRDKQLLLSIYWEITPLSSELAYSVTRLTGALLD